MNTKKLKFRLTLIGIVLLIGYSLCCTMNVKGQTTYYITLSPQEDRVYSVHIHKGDTLSYSVDVSSGTVGIILWESEQYFAQGYYEEYWPGITSTLSREFTPYWTDTFYLEIYNPSTTESAVLSFTYEDDNLYRNRFIMNSCITGGLLGVIILTNFLGKKTK